MVVSTAGTEVRRLTVVVCPAVPVGTYGCSVTKEPSSLGETVGDHGAEYPGAGISHRHIYLTPADQGAVGVVRGTRVTDDGTRLI